MGLKKLFEAYKRTRHLNKEEYKLKPCVTFETDTNYYYFALLPTIVFTPAPYRFLNSCAVEIWWLNFHICFGEWVRKDV